MSGYVLADASTGAFEMPLQRSLWKRAFAGIPVWSCFFTFTYSGVSCFFFTCLEVVSLIGPDGCHWPSPSEAQTGHEYPLLPICFQCFCSNLHFCNFGPFNPKCKGSVYLGNEVPTYQATSVINLSCVTEHNWNSEVVFIFLNQNIIVYCAFLVVSVSSVQ